MFDLTMAVKNKVLKQGLRVFIADEGKGDYGIFTNQAGTLVISFWPAPFGGMNFATSHKSINGKNTGQGNMIAEDVFNIDELKPHTLLNFNITTSETRPKTLNEHLKLYESSHYKEVYE